MNRVERAVRDAKLLPVTEEMLRETRAVAARRLADGKFRSQAAAETSAARTVAARHKTMPGPITVALHGANPERRPGLSSQYRSRDAQFRAVLSKARGEGR